MSRVLVTGGCGFIGSHLVDALLEEGHDVIVVDNLSTGKMDNIAHVISSVEFHNNDIRDLEALRGLTANIDYLYHQAALGSVPRSVVDPLVSNEVNVTGTLNVLVAARESGVKRVIFASSSSIYGDTPTLPKSEAMRPMPMSPYAVSKLAGEAYMQAFYQSYGMETVSLRYFNVFGPRQDPHSQYAAVIPQFASALLDNRSPVIYGDGMQSRDFTYVQNVVRANLLAMRVSETHGESVNVACGVSTTIDTLFALLCDVLEKDIEPVHVDTRLGDVKHSLADITAARILLGYQPLVDFTDGVRLTVEWHKECRKSADAYGQSSEPAPHRRI